MTRDKIFELYQTWKKAGNDLDVILSNVSQSQLSIIRHYGRINFNGMTFIHEPQADVALREDFQKFILATDKLEAKRKRDEERDRWMRAQRDMFTEGMI